MPRFEQALAEQGEHLALARRELAVEPRRAAAGDAEVAQERRGLVGVAPRAEALEGAHSAPRAWIQRELAALESRASASCARPASSGIRRIRNASSAPRRACARGSGAPRTPATAARARSRPAPRGCRAAGARRAPRGRRRPPPPRRRSPPPAAPRRRAGAGPRRAASSPAASSRRSASARAQPRVAAREREPDRGRRREAVVLVAVEQPLGLAEPPLAHAQLREPADRVTRRSPPSAS